MNLFVQEMKSQKERRITGDEKNDIYKFKWGGNASIFFLKDQNRDENFHLYRVNINEGDPLDLTPFLKVRVDWWDDDRWNNGKFFFAMNKRSSELQDLYSYDIKLDKMEMVYQNPGQSQLMGIKRDNLGVLRILIVSNGLNQQFLYRESGENNFRPIFETNFKDRIYPLNFDANNKGLYVSSNIGRDKFEILKIDPTTGKELETIYKNPDYDVNEFYYSFVRNKPVYVGFTDQKYRRVILDSSVVKSMNYTQELFPGLEIRLVDMDSSESHFILRIFNDRNLGYYYLYNKEENSMKKLADISPWILEDQMSSMKPIQIKSRDGLVLNGYVSIPVGSDGKNLPLIVQVHPGPFSRNVWTFDRETQFFNSRGYAVLQINYRGSSGYGKKFFESGFREWGRKIQDDITDASTWAIHSGLADSNRMAIYGYGFGGYCALMGAIRNPHLYSCVISYSGISNVFDFIKDVPPLYKVTANRLYETIGNPEKDFNYIQEVSPIFHVKQFSVPVFIAQGGKDNRVSINETDNFVRELRKNGVSVTYFVRPNEGSLFTHEEDKLEYYSELEQFLEKNLKSN